MGFGMLQPRDYLCVFTVLCSCFMLLASAQTTDPSEVAALRAVKGSLIDPLKKLQNWKKGDPCMSNWTGVYCFDAAGPDGYLHVYELCMMNMNLSGTLAPEIGQLSQLQILNFMWNDLTSSIPKEIGNVASLQLLLLNGNKLSGFLPEELGYLSNLNRLQVDQNNITGEIPKSFQNMSIVRHLHLNNNSISGRIPAELMKLSSLLHLLLDNNNLSGYLPSELANLPDLRILQLDNNNFNGSEIPASYGNLSKLVKLSLRNCSLSGAIPDLSRIPKLSYLDISWNHLSGSIPTNRLSSNMTTINLSHNSLNGSVPRSFSDLPFLQRLSLENNFLTGSAPANIWQNVSFTESAKLTVDFRNNSLSSISGDLNAPANVSLLLQGNPICNRATIQNLTQFCGVVAWFDEMPENSTNSTMICPPQACPMDNYYEYVPSSPMPCFCALPIRIGYRLKSPSFSFFPPYMHLFETYITHALNLDLYQLSVDSFVWDKGPRLKMYLKIYPAFNNHSNTFSANEIRRIIGIFTSWRFPPTDFFGPYELLNFTLLGPYANVIVEPQRRTVSKAVLAVIIVGAVAFAVILSTTVTHLITRRHAGYHYKMSRRHLPLGMSIKIDGVKRFTFKEMALATDNFDTSIQVGRGGYGKVYRGTLSDNTAVAIKRAEEGSLQGQKEFLTEIELLSRLHHRNLVSLIGFCDEEGEQMLVYEYMPNGTLRDWLSDKPKENLTFNMRLHIALGSAKGILYLHTEAHPPIFHRDIKASNILLDSKLTAKVADFGLSRLAPFLEGEGTVPNHVSTVVKGTPGYLDPEYLLTRKLTDKSDVYSLGVVFLELLTGMQPITHGKNIVREVNLAHQSGKLLSVVDSRMSSYPLECVERFAALALLCCVDRPEERPSMLIVVRELENILQMMPVTEITLSGSASASTSTWSSNPASSSLLHVSREISFSDVSGSDLLSGVVPTIGPR